MIIRKTYKYTDMKSRESELRAIILASYFFPNLINSNFQDQVKTYIHLYLCNYYKCIAIIIKGPQIKNTILER